MVNNIPTGEQLPFSFYPWISLQVLIDISCRILSRFLLSMCWLRKAHDHVCMSSVLLPSSQPPLSPPSGNQEYLDKVSDQEIEPCQSTFPFGAFCPQQRDEHHISHKHQQGSSFSCQLQRLPLLLCFYFALFLLTIYNLTARSFRYCRSCLGCASVVYPPYLQRTARSSVANDHKRRYFYRHNSCNYHSLFDNIFASCNGMFDTVCGWMLSLVCYIPCYLLSLSLMDSNILLSKSKGV